MKCLTDFPEVLDVFSQGELAQASAIGSYIFFEDYFMRFIEKRGHSDQFFARVAAFIETLAESDDADIRNLAQIALLEPLVNKKIVKIAPHLGKAAQKLLRQAQDTTRIDTKIWRLP